MTQGADFLQLDVREVPPGGRTEWLAARIRQAIADGTVGAGTRLPPTRVLAADLGLARGTVSEAYRRLAEQGLIVAHGRAGTVVVAPPHDLPRGTDERPARRRVHQDPTGRPFGDVDQNHSDVTDPDRIDPDRIDPDRIDPDRIDPSRIDLGCIDLSRGLPDLASFPRTAWLRAEREVLATAGAHRLGYAPPEGARTLREELSAWLARSRGVVAPAERIVITGGVTGALSLLAQVLRERGIDAIAVEDPGARGNRSILDHWMSATVPVGVDADGLDPAALAGADVRAVVLTPAHQYPTGVVLSPQRRRAIAAWATDRDGLVIEDDYDAEYRYDRAPVRALQPLAPESVAYTASLSKTLAPAMRLGWLVPPGHLHERVVRTRWATDLGSPVLPQLALAHMLRTGALERHLRTMRGRHRVRRDAAIAVLRELLPECPVQGIAAGLHLLVLLPDRRDDVAVAAAAMERGVVVTPLSRHRITPGPPGLVINYAGHRPDRLRTAIGLLAAAVRDGG